jgi:hypothetical protein
MGEVRGIVAVRVERLSGDSREAPETLRSNLPLGCWTPFGLWASWPSWEGSLGGADDAAGRNCTRAATIVLARHLAAHGKERESHALPEVRERWIPLVPSLEAFA